MAGMGEQGHGMENAVAGQTQRSSRTRKRIVSIGAGAILRYARKAPKKKTFPSLGNSSRGATPYLRQKGQILEDTRTKKVGPARTIAIHALHSSETEH